MPSGPGLRNALTQMGAAPGGERHVTWTSLREEPVLVSFHPPWLWRARRLAALHPGFRPALALEHPS